MFTVSGSNYRLLHYHTMVIIIQDTELMQHMRCQLEYPKLKQRTESLLLLIAFTCYQCPSTINGHANSRIFCNKMIFCSLRDSTFGKDVASYCNKILCPRRRFNRWKDERLILFCCCHYKRTTGRCSLSVHLSSIDLLIWEEKNKCPLAAHLNDKLMMPNKIKEKKNNKWAIECLE